MTPRIISVALEREELVTSDRIRKLQRPDMYRLLVALASVLSIAGVTRFAAPADPQVLKEPCPPFNLTIDQRGGLIAHVCGFVPGAGLLVSFRYDLTLRLRVRADHISSAEGP
jgi:hypothetical protein